MQPKPMADNSGPPVPKRRLCILVIVLTWIRITAGPHAGILHRLPPARGTAPPVGRCPGIGQASPDLAQVTASESLRPPDPLTGIADSRSPDPTAATAFSTDDHVGLRVDAAKPPVRGLTGNLCGFSCSFKTSVHLPLGNWIALPSPTTLHQATHCGSARRSSGMSSIRFTGRP